MKILTFDTSLDVMYVTIGNDDQVEISKIVKNTGQYYHSAFLIPVIIELLKTQHLTMQDIQAIGVNVGPGSFTGIRISAIVARIMSQSLDIPAVGISSFEIFSCINNTNKNALCLFDAKREKAYIGIYSPEGNVILEPTILPYNEVIKYAQNRDFYIITDNIMSNKLEKANLDHINIQESDINSGVFLNRLTYKHLKNNDHKKYEWFNLKPLYIQPPPISMPKTVFQ